MTADAIVGVTFIAAYVADLPRALEFYSGLLGLVQQQDMGATGCCLRATEDVVAMVHSPGPLDLGDGQAWFQCNDPAGNIIETVGRYEARR